MIEIKKAFTQRELRQFAGIWFPAFCGLVGFLLYRHTPWSIAAYIVWASGLGLGAIGVIYPAFIQPIYKGLLYATFPIGYVVSHLLLGLVFYGLVTPIGLIMRMLGRDPLERKLELERHSYWSPHQAPGNIERYFRQY